MHIFRRIFLSNYWWQKSDIWSQASYRYAILWEAFLDPSDSYFLFGDLVGFYTHWTYMLIFQLVFIHIEHICSFFVAFFSATIDGRNLIFGHKLHIGTPYRGKRFFDPSDSYFLFAKERGYHRFILLFVYHFCWYVFYLNQYVKIDSEAIWSWSYGSWIYYYLCNQFLSPLQLCGWILLRARCTRYNIMW